MTRADARLGRCASRRRSAIPVLVIWGLDDKALLPVQLEGIGEVGDDVDVVPLHGRGHFAPWEAPDAVAAALAPFLAGGASRYRRAIMTRSTSRSAARLAAVQALYQQEMEGTPIARLLHEFHAPPPRRDDRAT